jgi:N-acetyl sugar amidotransferase
MKPDYQICSRCIMDTSDPEIAFDPDGFCNHCTEALARMKAQLLPAPLREEALGRLVDAVRRDGKGKDYDCVIGISGGVDSTMTAYTVKSLGLRPLAVHFDNGWNAELAVDNIKKALDILKIDLHTFVVDWEEFRDVQLSFLRASLANCEIPTDHAIFALLWRTASETGLRFILTGSNVATEAIMPLAWGHYHQDLRHLRAVHERFGGLPMRTLPTISLGHYLYFVFAKGIRQIPFLNYIDYNRDSAKRLLEEKLGWRDYGYKHYESVWTRFFQGHYLPSKFGFDKRRAHLSTLICSGQMTREEALARMRAPVYDEALLRQDLQFVLKKFKLSPEEFDALLKAPKREAREFPSHLFLFHRLRRWKNLFRRIATSP